MKTSVLRCVVICVIIFIIAVMYVPALSLYLRGDDFEWLNQSYIGKAHPLRLLTLINYFFRPIIKLSYLLNYLFGGTNVVWYNATTIGIHLLNIALLYGLLLRIVSAWQTAAVIVLCFGASSLYSEVTLWAAGRPDSIMFIFWLLILHLLTRWNGTWRQHLLLLLLTCGAMGSKESWILLPFIAGSFLLLIECKSLKQIIAPLLSMTGLLVAYLLIFFVIPLLAHAGLPTSYANASLRHGMMKGTQLVMFYCGAGRLYVPGNLWQTGIVLGGLSVTAWWCWKRGLRIALWGLIWMGLTIAISLRIYHAASRYNYLPLVGFWIVIASIAEDMWREARRLEIRQFWGTLATICALLLYLSYHGLKLQEEILDYHRVGEAHRLVAEMYQAEKERIPTSSPVLFINRGTWRPLHDIARTTEGYQKLLFVRGTAIWELVMFDTLANFFGSPFQQRLMPASSPEIDHLLRQPRLTAVIFTDTGFIVSEDSSSYRAEILNLKQKHGTIPDNVFIYITENDGR